MELLQQNSIKESYNIEIKASSLILNDSISIGKKMGYPFIFEDKYNNNKYIYYRYDQENISNTNEIIKRYIIKDFYNNCTIYEDINYQLYMECATHNFRLFNINNNIYGIGGKPDGNIRYNELLKKQNIEIECDLNSNLFVSREDYKINEMVGTHIVNPNIYSPIYINGLYLFLFNDINNNIYNENNDKLPIISGIKEGRHDQYYGDKSYGGSILNAIGSNSKNIKNSIGGFSVFDSSTSLIYNENNKKYYLYQRANIASGNRYIQYCTSYDLKNWSNFNLLNISPYKDYFTSNLYYNNMFKINGINNYIGIIPSLNLLKQSLELYYSADCENWNLIGIINQHKYYEHWMVLGEPLLKDNKYYFYMSNSKELTLESYYIEKDRFSYATTSVADEIAKISFNNMKFTDKNYKLKINFKTFENGYIKMQLKDKDDNIIDGYSFNDFNVIGDNMDQFEYEVSWKNEYNCDFKNTEFKIELEGMNFNLYSINCVKIIN